MSAAAAEISVSAGGEELLLVVQLLAVLYVISDSQFQRATGQLSGD